MTMDIIRIDGTSADEIFESLSALDILCVGAEGWSANAFRDEAANENGIVICASENGFIAGLICGFYAADQADIASVAVHPDYRRKGIADALMLEFEKQLPDFTESIFLDVRESNVPAASLYEKHGFTKISVRRNYYEKPTENAVIMQKNLNKEG